MKVSLPMIAIIPSLIAPIVSVGPSAYNFLLGQLVAKTTGNFTLVAAVSIGALIATTSVLLTNLLGLSRVAFAVARNKQMPKSIAKVSSKFRTPISP